MENKFLCNQKQLISPYFFDIFKKYFKALS